MSSLDLEYFFQDLYILETETQKNAEMETRKYRNGDEC